MYLPASTVDNIFSAIDIYAPAGSEIIFDYAYSDVLAGKNTLYGAVEIIEGLKNIGEHWMSGIEKAQLQTYLNQYHIKLLAELDADILEQRFFTNNHGKILGKVNKALAIAHGIK